MSVDRYEKAMKAKDYHTALSAADQIRNVGLQFGSDAWNIAMDNNKNATRKKP